jgi:hypothetical protein
MSAGAEDRAARVRRPGPGATPGGEGLPPAGRRRHGGGLLATLERARLELAALDLAVDDAVAGTPSPTRVHYPGDVIIGALVGAWTGTATRLFARRAGLSAR